MPNISFQVAMEVDQDYSTADLDSGAKAHSAFPRIEDGDTIDLVVGQLLQPVPVESKPNVLVHLIGGRVIDMKGLPWLRVPNSEAYEWIVVDGIPEVVESRTEL